MALGTMTFGNQTPEEDAFRQMDMALDHGVTLWDCAEMYPVNPVSKETAGRSEAFLGRWFASRGPAGGGGAGDQGRGAQQRDPGRAGPGGRHGAGGLRDVAQAAPDRRDRPLPAPLAGPGALPFPTELGVPARDESRGRGPADGRRAGAASGARREGKVRAVGLSNETAWGTLRWRDRAEALGAPVMETVQNEYSLLARLYDTDMAEVAAMEGVTLLAFSPLGAGWLTGKYQNGAVPEGSRKALNPTMGGRASPRVEEAVALYHGIAREAGMDPVHMALAWHRHAALPVGADLRGDHGGAAGAHPQGLDAEVSPEVAKRIDEATRRIRCPTRAGPRARKGARSAGRGPAGPPPGRASKPRRKAEVHEAAGAPAPGGRSAGGTGSRPGSRRPRRPRRARGLRPPRRGCGGSGRRCRKA
jgi:aryl-alcohol dehydrogenase-like predicted oxidoreductase